MKTYHFEIGVFGKLARWVGCGMALLLGNLSSGSTWTGAFDSNWGDSRNWSGGVPGPSDHAIVNSGSVQAGGSRSVASLTVGGGSVAGLEVLATPALTMSGGAVSASAVNVDVCNVSGGTLNSASTVIASTGTWSGGQINGSVTINAGASVSIPSGSVRMGASAIIQNHGTVEMSGGRLEGYDSCTIENHGMWTLSVHADPFTQYFGGNVFNNHGLLRRIGGGDPVNLSNTWIYNLSGETRCESGELRFATTVNLPAGALLSGAGTIRMTAGGTHLSGVISETAGALILDGATLACTDTAAVTGTLDWVSGYLSGGLTVPAGSLLSVSGDGFRRMNGNSVVDNFGTFRWQAVTSIEGYDTVTINNHAGATFDFAVDGDPFTQYFGGNVFQNDGLMVKSGGSGICQLKNWTYHNNGVLQCNVGAIECRSVTELHGASSITGTGELQLNGNTRMDGNVTETIASLRLIGGTLTCAEGSQLTGELDWEEGTIVGTMGIPNGSMLDVHGAGFKRLSGQAVVNVEGTWQWTGPGAVEGYENCRVNIMPGGVCDFAADGDPFNQHFGGSELINQGSVVKSAGGGGSTVCDIWTFRQGGEIRCDVSSLEFTNTLVLEGGSTLSGAGEVLLRGAVSMEGNVTETIASLRMTGGTLSCAEGSQLTGELDWEEGIIVGTMGIPSGSLLDVHGEGFKRLSGGTVVNVGGTWQWTGPAGVEGFENCRVNILPGGVIDFAADGDPFNQHFGGNELINEGRVVKSAGGGGSTVCDIWTFRQRGEIRCDISTLEFTNTLVFENTSTVIGAGKVLIHGTTQLDGTVDFMAPTEWSGGTWNGGGGMIEGLLVWSGGSTNGNWQVANGATLRVVNGAGALKRLNHSALVECAGTIEMESGNLNGYEKSMIRILAGGQLVGTGAAAMDEFYDGANHFEILPGGTLTTEAGGDLRVDWRLDNHGTVITPVGLLTCTDGGTSSGRFESSGSGMLHFVGGTQTLESGAEIHGPGEVKVMGGALNAIVPVDAFVHLAGGTVQGSGETGDFRFRDGSQWTSGYLGGQARIPAGATFTVSCDLATLRRMNTANRLDIDGRLLWQGPGTIEAFERSVIEISPSGTLELAGDGELFSQYFGGHTLTNHGTILRSSSTDVATIRHFTCTNDQLIRADSGSLVFRASLRLEGGSTISGDGRTVVAEGRTTLVGTTEVSNSTFELAGAELYADPADNGTLSGNSILWSSGYVSGTVTWNGTATTSGGGFRRLNTKAELRNAGVLTLAGAGGIESFDRSILRNLSGGTLHATGQVALTQYFGGNQLINEGTMTIGTSPGRMIVNYPFIQTSSGRLVVGVAGANSANPDFDILQVNSTATLAGILVANLENGYDPGQGAALEVLKASTRVGVFERVAAPRFAVTYPMTGNPPVSLNNVVLVSNAAAVMDYDTWTIMQGLSGADALADADRDGDGTINLIEYALNLNAGAADVPPLNSGLESISNESWLVLHYRRWTDRVSAGLLYVPEGSATLADWSDVGVIDEPDPAAAVVPGSEARRCRVLVGEIRKFLRLRVEFP